MSAALGKVGWRGRDTAAAGESKGRRAGGMRRTESKMSKAKSERCIVGEESDEQREETKD